MPPPSEPEPTRQNVSDARRKFIQHPHRGWNILFQAVQGDILSPSSWLEHPVPGRPGGHPVPLPAKARRNASVVARDILAIPWAATFDWQGLSDQARSLESDHRTLGRETIRVSANLPPSPTPTPTPEQVAAAEAELKQIIDSLRRTIRLKNMAMATEETYVHWNCRFIRFCFQMPGQSPQAAGPPATTAYLDFLALERNVAPATQKQALNAMAFLIKL